MGALTGISKNLGAEENGAPAERISVHPTIALRYE
jgi:hypothetical protein